MMLQARHALIRQGERQIMSREAFVAEIIMEHLNHYRYGEYCATPTENTRRLAQEIVARLDAEDQFVEPIPYRKGDPLPRFVDANFRDLTT